MTTATWTVKWLQHYCTEIIRRIVCVEYHAYIQYNHHGRYRTGGMCLCERAITHTITRNTYGVNNSLWVLCVCDNREFGFDFRRSYESFRNSITYINAWWTQLARSRLWSHNCEELREERVPGRDRVNTMWAHSNKRSRLLGSLCRVYRVSCVCVCVCKCVCVCLTHIL